MNLLTNSIFTTLKTAVVLAAAVYAVVVVLVYLFQARLVFFPSSTVSATPASRGMAFEDVRFTADDGVALAGWYVPADSARATVIICHGNAGNISHRLYTIDICRRLGLNVFIFDYRGYGESGGSPSEEGMYRDAGAAWRWVSGRSEGPRPPVVVMGRSLGGPVAARLASVNEPSALILESTFTSFRDMGNAIHPWLPVRKLARYDFPTAEYLGEISCPVLIAHSPDDEIIPFRFGRELFQRAREPKTFLELEGGHNEGFLLTGERYVNGLDSFLSEHLGK